jgi:hypothetical protein
MKLIPTTLLALMLGATALPLAAKDAPDKDRPANEEEELALAALEGLVAQSPERALPILKKVLAGSQTPRVKRRALFVLGQIGTPEARDILLQTARSSNTELRREAIRGLGIDGDATALDALQSIYPTADAETKRSILQAWMIADRKEPIYQIAAAAKTEDEATEAIKLLGVMGATEELRKLADRPTSTSGLLDAYAVSGDLTGLRKLADGAGERSVRVDAVRRIGMIDTEAARTALREIYTRSAEEDFKEAALQGMLMSGDDKGVLALYRAAKTPAEKRSLLRTLSMMDSDAALEAIDATLEKKP